jgi:hypothetical protein
VTAYRGGLRALTTDAFRDAAEGILAAEAYHAVSRQSHPVELAPAATLLTPPLTACFPRPCRPSPSPVQGAVRLSLRNKAFQETGYAGTTTRELIGLIAALRDAADGEDGTQDADLSLLVPADASGIAYKRTVPGVLRIVYLGGTDKGGEWGRMVLVCGRLIAAPCLGHFASHRPLLDPIPPALPDPIRTLATPARRRRLLPRGPQRQPEERVSARRANPPGPLLSPCQRNVTCASFPPSHNKYLHAKVLLTSPRFRIPCPYSFLPGACAHLTLR